MDDPIRKLEREATAWWERYLKAGTRIFELEEQLKHKHEGWTEEAAAHLETAGREAVLREALEFYAANKGKSLWPYGAKARAALKEAK